MDFSQPLTGFIDFQTNFILSIKPRLLIIISCNFQVRFYFSVDFSFCFYSFWTLLHSVFCLPFCFSFSFNNFVFFFLINSWAFYFSFAFFFFFPFPFVISGFYFFFSFLYLFFWFLLSFCFAFRFLFLFHVNYFFTLHICSRLILFKWAQWFIFINFISGLA